MAYAKPNVYIHQYSPQTSLGGGTVVYESAATPTPAADFVGTPLSGIAPLTVSFQDLSNYSPTSWAWDFQNNGSTDDTYKNPVFTYSTPGVYSVKLTVFNEFGQSTAIKTGYITVTTAGVATDPPTIHFYSFDEFSLAGNSTSDAYTNQYPSMVRNAGRSTGEVYLYNWVAILDGPMDGDQSGPKCLNMDTETSGGGTTAFDHTFQFNRISYTVAYNTSGWRVTTYDDSYNEQAVIDASPVSFGGISYAQVYHSVFQSTSKIKWDPVEWISMDNLRLWNVKDSTITDPVYGESGTHPNTDPYWSQVVLLAHLTGTNGSTTFTDSSSFGHTITGTGGVSISTALGFQGGSTGSALFNGTGYLSSTSIPDYDFTDELTIEMYIRPTSSPGAPFVYLFSAGPTTYIRYNDTQLHASIEGITVVQGSFSFPLNQWSYVRLMRAGKTTLLSVSTDLSSLYTNNGGVTTFYSQINDAPPGPISSTLIFGADDAGTAGFFVGRMQEIRVTNFVDRYPITSFMLPLYYPFPEVGAP